MALCYSVKFRKLNFAGKLLLEKEGEIVLDRKYFRLKGKGANDHGEIVNLTDIKEVKLDKDEFVFITFAKDKYVLSRFGGNLEPFLEDFYRIKNEFFAEHLFMRVGMLMNQFDCMVEIYSQFEKPTSLGKCTIQFYEQSIVITPKMLDLQVIYLSFMKSHNFNEDEYLLSLETDSGMRFNVSKLGSNFEDVQETLEKCLEKMYQKVLNQLNYVLSGFSLQVLLKLAYAMRDGKAVSVSGLKKIDASLPAKVMEVAFSGNLELEKKIQFLRGLDKNEQFYVGLNFENGQDNRDVKTRAWFLCALPTLNTIVMGISNSPEDKRIFFFRIVMEQGIAADRVEGKILEINQCMVLFDYDLNPLFKDKNELRKGRYKVAILKLAFLRLFRRSYLGFSQAVDVDKFKGEAERLFGLARVLQKPILRHREVFRQTLRDGGRG